MLSKKLKTRWFFTIKINSPSWKYGKRRLYISSLELHSTSFDSF